MIFFFYGEDSFRAKNKIAAIKEKFKTTVDPSGHSIESLDGENLNLDDFFQTVTAGGFLASKKLVVIKNIFDNKKLKSLEEPLINYLEKQQDTTEENYLIFWQTSKPNLKNKLYKTLKKFKYTEEFEKLTPDKVSNWIKKELSNKNKKIDPTALNLLLAYVGENLWQLEQELSKLINFTQAEEISAAEVRLLVQAKTDDNIFKLVDLIGKKDKKNALLLLEQQLDSGVNALYILSMITRQFRILIKVKLLSEKINNSFAISQALKIHSFVAKKTLEQSKFYELKDLKKIYQLLLQIDAKLKRESVNEKILFLQMIEQL
ncbi:DNA polymerase III subunit delta [Candidatus Nomurabacteria bacterium]|nr:DNA polymerase III subunit delta [Candidatus Nomurabacteria bacterium]